MGHCVTAIITRSPALEGILKQHSLVAAELRDGWHLIPLENDDLDSLGLDFSQTISGFNYLSQGLLDLCAEHSHLGPLVYLETEYFGGAGDQGAVAFINGSTIPPTPATDDNAINTALKCVGIPSADSFDEFAYIGLGRHRHTYDWKEVAD